MQLMLCWGRENPTKRDWSDLVKSLHDMIKVWELRPIIDRWIRLMDSQSYGTEGGTQQHIRGSDGSAPLKTHLFDV